MKKEEKKKDDAGFEEMFARLIDRKMAPEKLKWMVERGTFNTLEFTNRFGNLNNSLSHYVNKELIKRVKSIRGGDHKKNKNYTVYEWIGPL